MTLVVILLVAYLFVAPDKATLTGTRGAAGALRAVLGMPPRPSRDRSKKGSASNSKSNGRRPLLAGWCEGVTAARQAREEGRDLWSHGSRISGRAAGGTRNLVGGVRTTVRTRRDRRHHSSTPTPDTQPVVADPTAEPTRRDEVHERLDQHPDHPDWPASFRRAASGPQAAVSETDPKQDGELLFSSKTDDLGAAVGDSALQEQKTSESASEVLEEPRVDDDRYYTWKNPETGNFFVFDRMNLDAPIRAQDKHEADFVASFYNSRNELATRNDLAPYALAEPFMGSSEPADSAASQTPTAYPAMGNTDLNTITRKDTTAMSIAGTELATLDEVSGEVDAAKNAIEALIEALSEIKGWGGGLPDRWSGTSWSTDGLDASISAIAEAASELKGPEGLMEQLTAIGEEIAKARTVGEAAAEARAKGDLSGFLSH
ncbi:hypothetical protein E0H75_42075 [Kribbella capetownensis]|uniref:Uncharacterized protein n=1 Tax=Kribbella capetownensis TaxID=1572659 RepID=A0A4R0IN56_9ACTN|nr:hypothetical protein [Kribbella capetownensis]TCC33850.1 hypothetical protein E0H75_42075 [Kribbella capetownensis]